MKKYLPLIVLALLIAVLVPVYVLVIAPSETDDEKVSYEGQTGSHGEKLSAMGRPYILDLDESQINILKVTNRDGGFEFYRGADGNMYLRGAEQHLYDSQLEKQLYINAATQLLAIEKYEEYDELSTYGLTPELACAIVEITTENGEYHKVIFGDKLATDGAYYAMLEGRNAVYVLDTMLEDVLFRQPRDFIYPLMVPGIDQTDYTSISDFSLKKNGEDFVKIVKMTPEEEAESLIYGQYRMTYPAEYTPSTENFSQILRSFIEFRADRVLDYGINEDKLAYYGFRTGMKFEISYTYNSTLYTLYFSGKTQNNTYYVYSPLFDLIGEISADTVPFLEWDIIKYVDRNIFMINIDNIAAIDFVHSGTTSSFTLDGEKDDLSVTLNGKKIDTTNFRYFYKSLLSICIDGYDSMPEGASPDLTLYIRTKSDKVLHFNFYDTGSLRAFFTLNGSGEFYVSRDYLKTAVSNLTKLANGEMIE